MPQSWTDQLLYSEIFALPLHGCQSEKAERMVRYSIDVCLGLRSELPLLEESKEVSTRE
jgi:hypothetical protein